jgi:hypothetical protein
MIQMKRDHSDLTDKFFLLCFLSGLKDHIKHAIKIHQPSTLRQHTFMLDNKNLLICQLVGRCWLMQQCKGLLLPKPSGKTPLPTERVRCYHNQTKHVSGANAVRSIVHVIQMQ